METLKLENKKELGIYEGEKTLGDYKKQYRKLKIELAKSSGKDYERILKQIEKLNEFYSDKYSVHEIGQIQQDVYVSDFEMIEEILKNK